MAHSPAQRDFSVYRSCLIARHLPQEHRAHYEPNSFHFSSKTNKSGRYLEWVFDIERKENGILVATLPENPILYLSDSVNYADYSLGLFNRRDKRIACLHFSERHDGEIYEINEKDLINREMRALKKTLEEDPDDTESLIKKIVELWAEPGFRKAE